MKNAIWLLMEDFAGWHIKYVKKNGFLQIVRIAKIKLIGQVLWHGDHFQNHIRRTETMITFLLGFTIGTIFGVVGLVCVAIMYDKHHPDE